MIALDAGVLIALLDGDDAHHEAAVALFTTQIDEAMTISPINLAEVLVRAAAAGRDDELLAAIESLGISVTPLPVDAAARLARLRARSTTTMPDCCALLAAQQNSGRLATFDQRLRAAAERLGLTVVEATSP